MKKKYIKPEISVTPEIWKVYYEGIFPKDSPRYVKYEISNLGHIKYNEKLVKPYTTKTYNYLCYKCCAIHRAVAELFVPNPENKPCVDHIDTNPLNNCWYNLRWVTPKENMQNPITKEHVSKSLKGLLAGEKNPMYGKRGELSPLYNIPLSEKHKLDISKSHKGMKWMSNGIKRTYVHKEQFEKYIEMGYHFGMK